jgi:hypothetical protein
VTGTITYPPGSQVPDKSVSVLVSKGGKFQLVVDRAPKYMPPKEIAK